MATSVKLDSDFVLEAKAYAHVENRSVSSQIEYWAKIGKVMIDNPDLSYEFVHESLLATEEIKQGFVTTYKRRTTRYTAK